MIATLLILIFLMLSANLLLTFCLCMQVANAVRAVNITVTRTELQSTKMIDCISDNLGRVTDATNRLGQAFLFAKKAMEERNLDA